jgi:hypothetical protein
MFRPDRVVGQQYWFEYHCWESDESADAPLWHRSHEKVTIVKRMKDDAWEGSTFEERNEAGALMAFLARWDNGFEWCVIEDELLDSPSDFFRPDPRPCRKS